MTTSGPEVGSTETASLTVQTSDLASSAKVDGSDSETAPDNFAPVLATARMISLMEIAASRMLYPYLTPDQLSVGVTVNITHEAATPVGETVEATATFLRREGKLFVFDVVAYDKGGRVGSGEHRRAIITADRLNEGSRKRIARGSGKGSKL